MSSRIAIEVKPLDAEPADDLIVFAGEGGTVPAAARDRLGKQGLATLERIVALEAFKGKLGSALNLAGNADFPCQRLSLVGTASKEPHDLARLGGAVGALLKDGRSVSVLAAIGDETLDAAAAAELVMGMRLRGYRFDAYKTKKKGDDEDAAAKSAPAPRVRLHVADVAGMRKALKTAEALAAGVEIARDLVNEPPNVLTPEAFAKRAAELEELGVEVEILDEKQMKKIGMRALLGVGQGSERESRVAIMRWNGGKSGTAPVAFIGKGVTFDTGGISIKPAAGMEDMKGDMAGAACVVGLMHALAARKAKANVIGAIGLAENMPDGAAQRPGDIVTSLSGQTIEIINTDAEGRLVLADVLWYVQDRYKPQFMVNLATLTGAILVALGKEHAGLFSNNDTLAERLAEAGKATGETVWRMPMGKAYDKMIDSKFADMKNTGGRHAGSITAAQFLQRFVNDTPWAHLDIAGTGMDSNKTEISQGWASGWGVRLLDRLVKDHYE